MCLRVCTGVVSHEGKNNGVIIPPEIRGRDPPRSEACYDGESLQNGQGNCGSVEIWHASLVIRIAVVAVAAVAIGRHCFILGMSLLLLLLQTSVDCRERIGDPREGMVRTQGLTQLKMMIRKTRVANGNGPKKGGVKVQIACSSQGKLFLFGIDRACACGMARRTPGEFGREGISVPVA